MVFRRCPFLWVWNFRRVPNVENIEIDEETMITTPTDEPEGPVKVEEGVDKDPVAPKDTEE